MAPTGHFGSPSVTVQPTSAAKPCTEQRTRELTLRPTAQTDKEAINSHDNESLNCGIRKGIVQHALPTEGPATV